MHQYSHGERHSLEEYENLQGSRKQALSILALHGGTRTLPEQ